MNNIVMLKKPQTQMMDIPRFANQYIKIKLLMILMVNPIADAFGFSAEVISFGVLIDILYLVFHKSSVKEFRLSIFNIIAATMFLYYLCHWAVFGKGLTRTVQLISIFCTFAVAKQYEWKEDCYKYILKINHFLLFAYYAFWLLSGFQTNYFQGFYRHSNYLGAMLFYCIAFDLLIPSSINRTKLLSIIFALVLLFMSNSRTYLLASIILLLGSNFIALIKSVRAKNRFVIMILICALFFAIWMTVIYPSLYETEIGIKIEEFSRKFLRKNFFSGRQFIWKRLFEQIKLSLIFGSGLSKIPADYFVTEFSGHNLWLQTILQTGIVGVILLVAVLMTILKETIRAKKTNWDIVAVFTAGIIITQTFEVSITQNNLTSGIIAWLIWGITLSDKCRE